MKYPTELTGKTFGGIYVHEPSAVLSNLAILIICVILVGRHARTQNQIGRYWLYFVIWLGLATFGGIFSHGFPTYLTEKGYFPVWFIKNAFVLVANYFASMAVLSLVTSKMKLVKAILAMKAFILAVLLYATYNFAPAAADLGITYLLIIFISWKNVERESSSYLLKGFVVAFLSGIFYLFPFSILDDWFTNKDAVHLFAVISLLYVSKAIAAYEREGSS